ncbi:MAG: polymer-forming cytoskeletal protein [Bernardetiaceae bacterium]|nr:polymer-forming cytoskeletal protein [Bernardetiaceae bacterium]
MGIFNSKKQDDAPIDANNIIGKGTQIDGNLKTLGNIRIDGEVKGNIFSQSKVALGQNAVIEGNIEAQYAEIEGTVTGDLQIYEQLTLKSTALVKGNIQAKKIMVEVGAKFYGQCTIGDELNHNNKADNHKAGGSASSHNAKQEKFEKVGA